MVSRLLYFAGAALLIAAPATTFAQDASEITEEQIEQLIQTLRERNEQVRQLNARVGALEAELEASRERLSVADSALQIASQSNAELMTIGMEIIDRYEDRTLGDRVASGEPFTKLYRVRLENALEEYRDRIAAQGFYPTRVIEQVQSGQSQP